MRINRLIGGVLLLALTSCTTTKRVGGNSDSVPATDELVIVATSDFHSSLDHAEGMAKVIRQFRAKYGEHMIYLDGGDLFQGSIEGNSSKGRAIIDFYNLLGLDAATIGNHDLDYGVDVPERLHPLRGEDGMGNLKARARQANFNWISANIVQKRGTCRPHPGASHCNALGQKTVFEPHVIIKRLGKKICVIGTTTPTTPAITRPPFIREVRFVPLKELVAAEAKFLREKEACDLVMMTTHAGLLCGEDGRCLQPGDRAELLRLLPELPPAALDAIVAGHNHVPAQELINGIPVLQPPAFAKGVGVMHLTGTHEKMRVRYEPMIPIPDQAEVPDVTARLKPYRDAANEIRSQLVGSTRAEMPRIYYGESALGNMLADAILAAGKARAGAQFAYLNAGGIRAGLGGGKITYGDIYKVTPFDNTLVVADLTGKELRRALEIALSGGHGLGPVSGLKIKRYLVEPGQRGFFDRDLDGDGKTEDWERAVVLEITDEQGHPIRDDAHYKVATLDFLTLGGDHEDVLYKHIPKSRIHVIDEAFTRDLTVEFLKHHPDIEPSDFYSPARPRIELVPVPKR